MSLHYKFATSSSLFKHKVYPVPFIVSEEIRYIFNFVSGPVTKDQKDITVTRRPNGISRSLGFRSTGTRISIKERSSDSLTSIGPQYTKIPYSKLSVTRDNLLNKMKRDIVQKIDVLTLLIFFV